MRTGLRPAVLCACLSASCPAARADTSPPPLITTPEPDSISALALSDVLMAELGLTTHMALAPDQQIDHIRFRFYQGILAPILSIGISDPNISRRPKSDHHDLHRAMCLDGQNPLHQVAKTYYPGLTPMALTFETFTPSDPTNPVATLRTLPPQTCRSIGFEDLPQGISMHRPNDDLILIMPDATQLRVIKQTRISTLDGIQVRVDMAAPTSPLDDPAATAQSICTHFRVHMRHKQKPLPLHITFKTETKNLGNFTSGRFMRFSYDNACQPD